METDRFLEAGADDEVVSERDLSRLRWRCRRGLLENDLFIERFFQRYERHLTYAQARGLYALMALADNDLLDLLLARREPGSEWVGRDAEAVWLVLAQLREPPSPTLA